MRRPWLGLLALLLTPAGAGSTPAPFTIAAAENAYGELAKAVAGSHAEVVDILSNPDQEPHLFEADPKTARALSNARAVIANSADYDASMEKLLSASRGSGGRIVVADLVGKKPGANPHLWYDPAAMKAVADELADDLGQVDRADSLEFRPHAEAFVAGLKPVADKIAEIKKHDAGVAVTASEPVFGSMAQGLGLEMRNERFQTAVMNSTEASPADVATFENDLKRRRVKVMLRTRQADDQAVSRPVGIADDAYVPVAGVSESQPAGRTYKGWLLDQVADLESALAGGRS